MVPSEREMVEKFPEVSPEGAATAPERFTSLQPTYEDTLPDEDLGWDDEQGS